jgi:hypothetical protein
MENDFAELVSFLSVICWQALGKVANPVTGKPEKNLVFARRIIDLFEMLQEKTKGNLTADEVRILEYTLAELRLNYVDEKTKEDAAKVERKTENADTGKVADEKSDSKETG